MRWALLLLAACGAKEAAPPPALDAPVTEDASPEAVSPDLDDDGGPVDVASDDLGAIPAWRAVVDRDQYLARRGDHGVVEGVLAGAADPYWLVDDTEGNGALAIRVRLGATPAPATGSRLAIGGAWTVDDARHWVWVADQVSPLPANNTPVPALPPGLTVAVTDPPPGTHRKLPDKAGPGDTMEMTVVSLPLRAGDGWGVSSERYGTLLAYVILPGEHPAYGGHDLRAADEKWVLKKGQTYWVKVGKVRKGKLPTDPAVIEAASPPVRFP